MLFGIPEIIEYQKTCKDEKVLIIIKRFFEARNKNALWCETVAKLESENKELKSEIERLKKENEILLRQPSTLPPEYDLSKLVRVPLEKSLRMKHSLNSNVFSNLTKKQWEEYAGKILVINPATDKILLSVESEDLIDEEKIKSENNLEIIELFHVPKQNSLSKEDNHEQEDNNHEQEDNNHEKDN